MDELGDFPFENDEFLKRYFVKMIEENKEEEENIKDEKDGNENDKERGIEIDEEKEKINKSSEKEGN